MRLVLAPIFAIALIAASEEEGPTDVRAGISDSAMPNELPALQSLQEQSDDEVSLARQFFNRPSCVDEITHARGISGQLPLQLRREPALPDKPLAIYAVDRKQDGCSVMVMMGDPDDIRPLPLPAEGPMLQQIPAGLDQ